MMMIMMIMTMMMITMIMMAIKEPSMKTNITTAMYH
jgi:hypothetical protein